MTDHDQPDDLADPHLVRSIAEVEWLWRRTSEGARCRTTCGYCGSTARRSLVAAREWFLSHDCRDARGRPTAGRKHGPTLTDAEARVAEEREQEERFWRYASSLDLEDAAERERWLGRAATYVLRARRDRFVEMAARRTLEGERMNAVVLERLASIEAGQRELLRLTSEIAENMRERSSAAEAGRDHGAEVIDLEAARRRLRKAA